MLVLIDGHNLIARLPDIQLDDADDEEQLLLKIRRYQARKKQRVTVVFDAGLGYKPGSKHRQGRLTVEYAPSGRTADQIIINRLRNASSPKQILVVTSDRAIQRVAKDVGASIISSDQFAAELTLPVAKPDEEAGQDVALSPEEVEAWLKLFNQKGTGKSSRHRP
jgi:predicted RNA-binding protein with PIN domain